MKITQLIPVGLLWLAPLSVAAQSELHGPPHSLLRLPGLQGNAAKTTATSESRLIAEVSGSFDTLGVWTPYDSVTYSYDGRHTGDREVEYPWEQRISSIRYDEAVYYRLDLSGNYYKTVSKSQISYNALDQQEVQDRQIWGGINWQNTGRTFRHYTAAGLCDTEVTKLYDFAVNDWKDRSRVAAGYNTAQQMIDMQFDEWDTATRSFRRSCSSVFSYSGNNCTGRLDTIWYPGNPAIDHFNYTSYYYDPAAATVAQTTRTSYTGKTWYNGDSVISTYNPDGSLGAYETYNWSDYPAFKWWKLGRILFLYNAAGKKVGTMYEVWNANKNAYEYRRRETCSYNAFDQMMVDDYVNGDGSGYRRKYYYERLSDLSAQTSGLSPLALTIIPIPAGDFIDLSLTTTRAESLSFAIYDAAGRAWGNWQENVNGRYSKRIGVTDLPPGVYSLRVITGNGSAVKCFVVGH